MAKGIIRKMVTVTVARGHTLQLGKRGSTEDPLRFIGPTKTAEVADIEVQRLLEMGFIEDPSPKRLPSGVEDIDMGIYTNSSDGPAPELKMPGRPLSNKENAPLLPNGMG